RIWEQWSDSECERHKCEFADNKPGRQQNNSKRQQEEVRIEEGSKSGSSNNQWCDIQHFLFPVLKKKRTTKTQRSEIFFVHAHQAKKKIKYQVLEKTALTERVEI